MLTLEVVTPAHPKFVLLSAKFDALIAHQHPQMYRAILSSSRVHPGSQCWLIRYKREVIGCAALTLQSAKSAAVVTLYLSARQAGKGIERKVLRLLEAEARKRRIQRLVLPSRSHWPGSGHSLEEMGFRRSGGFARRVKGEGLNSYVKQL